MPAYTLRPGNLPNIVRDYPKLPIENYLGSVDIQTSFESSPTASATYEGVPVEELVRFEQTYGGYKSARYNRRFSILGIPFRVSPDGGYSYDRTPHLRMGEQRIDVYTVTISFEYWYDRFLEREVKVKDLIDSKGFLSLSKLANKAKVKLLGPSAKMFLGTDVDADELMSVSSVIEDCARVKKCYVEYGPTVRLRRYGSGRSHEFPWELQTTDGSNSIGLPPYYNGEILSWTKLPKAARQSGQTKDGKPDLEFEETDPEVKTEHDGDENYMNPPSNCDRLVDLSSNFDEGGPQKVYREVTTINGTPDTERTETWGFAYLLKDGNYTGFNESWIIRDPGAFWTKVEERQVKHIYRKAGESKVTFSLNVSGSQDSINFDFSGEDGEFYRGGIWKKKVFAHPDYKQYVTADLSKATVKIASVEYLIETVTKGWKLNRYIKDGGNEVDTYDMNEEGYENLDKIDQKYFSAAHFKKLEYSDRTMNWLKPARKDYKVDSYPFSIEWSSWSSLDDRIKAELVKEYSTGRRLEQWADTGIGDEVQIGLVVPDMNYVEPYMVWTSSKAASSVGCIQHPEHDPPDDKRVPITTGVESYYMSDWQKLNEERAREKTSEYSAQGDQFSASTEKVQFKEVYGKPPDAQVRKTEWKENDKANQKISATDEPEESEDDKWIYRIYTRPIPDWADEVASGSISNPYAYSKQDAKDAAETSLEVDILQSSTKKSRTVTWYYPDISPGDRCVLEGDRFANIETIVTSVNISLRFDGTANRYGIRNICLCEGTAIEMGQYEPISVRVEREADPDYNPDSGNEPQGGEDDNSFTGATKEGRNLGGVLANTVPNRRNIDPEEVGYYR